jgi:hypothetical protein
VTAFEKPLELRKGTWSLLKIVQENDRGDAFVRNSALWICLSRCVKLRELPDGSISGDKSSPTCFLEFASLELSHLRGTQAKYIPPIGQQIVMASDYDLQAFQAFGLMLADICWPERDATNFSGPSFSECLSRLRSASEDEMCWKVIQHYFGNILQYLFGQARIRQQVRGLPPETESELRTTEAFRMTQFAKSFVAVRSSPKSIWSAIDQMWTKIRNDL